jgi:GMP synthase (glutamine-hydrolysing)
MPPIVILRTGDVAPDISKTRGEYGDWIRAGVGDAWRGDWREVDVRCDDAPMPTMGEAAAFVVTGSSASVTERAPWMLRTQAMLRDVVAAGVPLLGICFGHQLVAQALGGEVAKNPRGREIGMMRVTVVADDPLFEDLPRAFDVNGTHVDAVLALPPGAEVLATTPRDPFAAFRVGANTRCVQFHPEMDSDAARAYVRARAHLICAEGDDPDALFAAIRDDTRGSDVLRSFVRRFVYSRLG